MNPPRTPSPLCKRPSTIILGATPAALSAACLLAEGGAEVTVLESQPDYFGGVSKSSDGGMCPEGDFLRPRLAARLFYRGKFFSFPLRPLETVRNLGVFESLRCGMSYLRAHLFPVEKPRNCEQWVINRFGQRLFQLFFKTCTEKAWGMSCRKISSDWAAQRLGVRAVTSGFLSRRSERSNALAKPEDSAARVIQLGGTVKFHAAVIACRFDAATQRWQVVHRDVNGCTTTTSADHVISGVPIPALVGMLSPAPSAPLLAAAAGLKYRDCVTVVLTCEGAQTLTDNAIAIHEPRMQASRIQNFGSASPRSEAGGVRARYGVEYLCQEGDKLWSLSDSDLVDLASFEMEWLGLIGRGKVRDGCVVRQSKAFPIPDLDHERNVKMVCDEIERTFPSLHLVGCTGMTRLEDRVRCTMTATHCAEKILAGEDPPNRCAVNGDAPCHASWHRFQCVFSAVGRSD